MKTTNTFKQSMCTYLERQAEIDELFAERYADPKKNIDDCTTYILNQIQASVCHGFADKEIYAIVLHYYDEPDIEIGKPIDCRVMVNHTVELTTEKQNEADEQIALLVQ